MSDSNLLVILLPYHSCSGLELFGLRFASDLMASGRRVIVAAPKESLIGEQCRLRNLPLFNLKGTTKYELSIYPDMLRLFKNHNPAAIIAFRTQMLYPLYFAMFMLKKRPFLYLFYRIGAGKIFRKDPIHRFLFKQLSAVVPNADHVKNRILNYWGIAPQKVRCIKSGVDTNKYYYDKQRRDRLRLELNISDSDFIIGNCGRIQPQKGSELLLRSLFEPNKGAAAGFSHVHLVYIGREYQEGYAQYLLNLAKDFGKEKQFHILPFRDDIESVYSGFDIFCLAVTTTEAYAYTVLEAMASETPPLVPYTGGLVEMLDDKLDDKLDGWYFKCGSQDSLTEQLVKIISMDRVMLKEVGKRARQKIIAKASWDAMMKEYYNLFKETGFFA